jgi:uncharacterized protein
MGNPFVHIELTTGDVATARRFYKKVFDWKLTPNPAMGGWTGIDVGKGVGGGIGAKQTPDEPTAWTAFVAVADVKKTIAKAKKAGATIVVPYMPIADFGALGVFVDPTGATLGVWEEAKKAPAKKKASAKKVAKRSASKAKQKARAAGRRRGG